jgi:hypothetical protein
MEEAMSLNIRRIQEYLEAEDVWMGFNPRRRSFGKVGTHAPQWAKTAVETKMVPRLDGKLATVNLNDWQLLALWCAWMGPRFREAEAGQHLVAMIEQNWQPFKEWLWKRFES